MFGERIWRYAFVQWQFYQTGIIVDEDDDDAFAAIVTWPNK